MASQLIQQGTLNRLRASVVVALSPELNVTASYLGEEGLNLSLDGALVDNLPTMVGTVTSPAPFQMATVEMELLKSQAFANLYKRRLESNAVIGDITVRTDSSTLGLYLLRNCSIMAAGPGSLNGRSVGFRVALQGYYQVNSSLFQGA